MSLVTIVLSSLAILIVLYSTLVLLNGAASKKAWEAYKLEKINKYFSFFFASTSVYFVSEVGLATSHFVRDALQPATDVYHIIAISTILKMISLVFMTYFSLNIYRVLKKRVESAL